MQHIRPSGQPPKVWQVIERTDHFNGKPMKFTIQEIPEDRYEDAIKHMCTYFLADEIICNRFDAINDPLFVEDMSTIWRLSLAKGISIAAFIDDPNGGKPIIAGMDALDKAQKDSISELYDYQFKSNECKHMFEFVSTTMKVVYNRCEVDKYLYTVGLSVHPDYQGYGLSEYILKIRDRIGYMYGMPATAIASTSIFSEEAAERAGFEKLLTICVDVMDKKYAFPDTVEFNIMGKRLS